MSIHTGIVHRWCITTIDKCCEGDLDLVRGKKTEDRILRIMAFPEHVKQGLSMMRKPQSSEME